MNKFIQQNKKKLLAIFTALLMIPFVASSAFTGRMGRDPSATVGKMNGDVSISDGEIQTAYHDLQAMEGVFPMVYTSQDEYIEALQRGQKPLISRVYEEFLKRPVLYVLLQKEAEAAGIEPPADEVTQLAASMRLRPGVDETSSTDAIKAAARRFLLVRYNFMRILGRQKPAMTEVMYQVHMDQQQTVNLIEIKAEEYVETIPTPPDAEIRMIYERFADKLPASGEAAATQPAAFGYFQPTKLKLQYLQIPKSRLADLAVAQLSEDDKYNLDRLAFSYYDENTAQFETKSEEQAAPQALGPPTSAPASGPTTKPFETVVKDIRRQLLSKEIEPSVKASPALLAKLPLMQAAFDARLAQLRQAVADRLSADFKTWSKGEPVLLPGPATPPAGSTQPTAVASIPAPPLNSPMYLDAVLRSMVGDPLTVVSAVSTGPSAAQKPLPLSAINLGFFTLDLPSYYLPASVHSMEDTWYTGTTLNNANQPIYLATIGSETFATLAIRKAPEPEGPFGSMPSTGPSTVPSTMPSTMPTTRPAARSAWALYQPSPLLVSPKTGDGFVFRLTAFQGERVPPLDEVRDTIIKQIKLNKAYGEAHKKAQNLQEEASRKSNLPNGGLPDIADLIGQKLMIAGPIAQRLKIIPGYPSADPSSVQLIKNAVMMLTQKATIKEPHPSMVIDLPSLGRTLVAELRSLERPWMQSKDYERQREMLEQLGSVRNPQMMMSWFSGDAIMKRTGYTGSKGN